MLIPAQVGLAEGWKAGISRRPSLGPYMQCLELPPKAIALENAVALHATHIGFDTADRECPDICQETHAAFDFTLRLGAAGLPLAWITHQFLNGVLTSAVKGRYANDAALPGQLHGPPMQEAATTGHTNIIRSVAASLVVMQEVVGMEADARVPLEIGVLSEIDVCIVLARGICRGIDYFDHDVS